MTSSGTSTGDQSTSVRPCRNHSCASGSTTSTYTTCTAQTHKSLLRYILIGADVDMRLLTEVAMHPIAALQIEYSPVTLDTEDPKIVLLKTASTRAWRRVHTTRAGGRWLLTGKYKSLDDFEEGDFRLSVARYSKENFLNMLKLADGLKKIEEKSGVTAGQVSLRCGCLRKGTTCFPSPELSLSKCVIPLFTLI